MIAYIKWDGFSPGYIGSSLMLSLYGDEDDDDAVEIGAPRIYIHLVFKDEDNDLESEGEVSLDDLFANALRPDEPADEQLALAKYLRDIAGRLEKSAESA